MTEGSAHFQLELVTRKMTCFSIQVPGSPKSCPWPSWQCPFSPGPRLCLRSMTPSSPVASCTGRLFVLRFFEYPKLVPSLQPLELLCPPPGMLFPQILQGPSGLSSDITFPASRQKGGRLSLQLLPFTRSCLLMCSARNSV